MSLYIYFQHLVDLLSTSKATEDHLEELHTDDQAYTNEDDGLHV